MRERDAVLIERAADLRRRLTPAEMRLWSRLKNRQLVGAKFSRQIPTLGYICDFACREHRLVVEVDGSQHADSDDDRVRDSRLQAAGYRVLRFWNGEILNSDFGLESALDRIGVALREGRGRAGDAHPLPLPVGEGSPRT